MYQDPMRNSVEFTSKLARELLSKTDYNALESIIAGVGTLAHVIRHMTSEQRREQTINMASDMLRTYVKLLGEPSPEAEAADTHKVEPAGIHKA